MQGCPHRGKIYLDTCKDYLPYLPLLNVKRAKRRWSTIQTCSDFPRESLEIFRENDRKRFYNLRAVFGKFSEIIGNLWKIFGKLLKTS